MVGARVQDCICQASEGVIVDIRPEPLKPDMYDCQIRVRWDSGHETWEREEMLQLVQ